MLAMTSACSSDDDAMDLSRLCVEMCEVTPKSAKVVSSCVLDDERMLQFAQPVKLSWAAKADSTYRGLIYYNKVEGDGAVEVLNLRRVPCVNPVEANDSLKVGYDPLGVTSVWYAHHGRYLNMCLSLKSGDMDSDNAHLVAVVKDSVHIVGSNARYYYTLRHSQNNVPMYYTVETYISVPTSHISKGDTVSFTFPLADGPTVRDYVY